MLYSVAPSNNTSQRSLYFFQRSLLLFSVSWSCPTLCDHMDYSRLPCPSASPGAFSNSCLSRWCHPTISSSVIPFPSCLQSVPASGSFPMSRFFASGGQSIGASASVLPMSIQDWFPLGLTGLISLQFKGLSRVFYNSIVWRQLESSLKASILHAQPFLLFSSHICTWLLGKL